MADAAASAFARFSSPMIKTALLLAAACALASGCATTKATGPAETRESAARAEREEYHQQTSLGSWVPRRVKKSDTAAPADDSAERRTLEQMRTDQMVRSMPKAPGG
jgi:hypothetical protein